MNLKLRLFISTILVLTVTAVAGLFLSKPRPVSATPSSHFPTYTTGSFTFSNPVEMVRPASMVFFQQGGEPETKVDIFGNIYVTAIQGVPGGVDLWKSIDGGASFVYMGQPDGAQDKCPSIPQCAALGGGDDQIDISSGGYLYISSLWLGNVTMSSSYDGATGGVQAGQKWEVHPAAAGVPSDDRQWVAAYGPQTIAMTYNATSVTRPPGGIGLFFVKSTDSGKTFGPPVEITAVTATDSVNVEGNLVVDPYTGTFYTTYIPRPSLNNVIRFASSTDGGATWNVTTAYTGATGTTNRGVFPIIAVDRGGNVHLAFTNSSDDANHNNCHVLLTSTANPAAATPTWTTAVQVDNSGAATGTAVQPWVVGGSSGIADVTWLGSTGVNPNTAPFDWHVFFAQVTNALTGSPTIAVNQAETAQVHDATICFNGGGCAAGTRTMLEYYAMAVDRNGNANIAYPDSINNCPAATCLTNAWFTKQTGGPSAYTPPAGPAPATFAANVSVPNSSGTAEPNSETDSYNCIYGGSIGGPIDYLSTDAGLSFTERPVVIGTGLHGGDFDIITLPQASGARPDFVYTADLGITTVHIGKSVDRNVNFFQPGTMGAAGEVSVSSDRMWLAVDRGAPTATDQQVYLMDHELASEVIRFAALTNDTGTPGPPDTRSGAWSPFNSGTTDPELTLPPSSTLPNTNPGPVFVNKANHNIYGCFAASTTTTNLADPPFGKMPNAWEAVGAPPAAAGAPPGPFTNHAAFRGLIDSATTAPAGTTTYGTHIGSLWPSGDADSAGNVYVVWAMNNARPNAVQGSGAPTSTFDIWMAASHDFGVNFYGPWRVSSGVGTATFPWIAAGDAGRVDIVWFQSSGVPPPLLADPTSPGTLTGGPNAMPAGSTWNVMFGQSLNANSREPVFTVSTASDHIIHTGSISNGGLTGSSDRSLLDFFQVSIGPDGLANIFNADNGTSGLHINYVRQNGGPLGKANPSAVTCLPIPVLTSVVSRMTHGTAGDFDVNMPLPPNSSPRGVECRSSTAGNYKLVFTFTANLTSVVGATVTGHDPTSGTGMVSGGAGTIGPGLNQYTVNLTNVSNAQYITVTLNSVLDATGASGNIVSPQLGILIGDVSANGVVTNTDVGAVKAQVNPTTPVTLANFRDDVTVNGFVTNTDVGLVKGQVNPTGGLPTPP